MSNINNTLSRNPIIGMMSALGITAITPSFAFADASPHKEALEFIQNTLPYIQYLGALIGVLIGLLTVKRMIKGNGNKEEA